MKSGMSLFEIQEIALKTSSVPELEVLLEKTESAEGTESDRFALKLFLNGKIKDPTYPSLTNSGR